MVDKTGRERGITSSFTATRGRPRAIGWNRNVSYTKRIVVNVRFSLHSDSLSATCLDGVDRQGQRIQIFGGKRIAPAGDDLRAHASDFLAHAFLVLGVLGQLIQHERQGGRRGLVPCEREGVHLGDELLVVQARFAVCGGVCLD